MTLSEKVIHNFYKLNEDLSSNVGKKITVEISGKGISPTTEQMLVKVGSTSDWILKSKNYTLNITY